MCPKGGTTRRVVRAPTCHIAYLIHPSWNLKVIRFLKHGSQVQHLLCHLFFIDPVLLLLMVEVASSKSSALR
uniref:Uncharacterized protein n=1 Tax=Aegilops tauschii subsp. strangulata TaxID=200361 RepID=A0A453P4G9_AEGTS